MAISLTLGARAKRLVINFKNYSYGKDEEKR